MECLLWLLLGLSTIHTINAAEVLAITPIGASSHWNIMSAVLEALLKKGHKITVVSPFPRKVSHENYTEIDVSKLVPFAIASPWKTVKIILVYEQLIKNKRINIYLTFYV